MTALVQKQKEPKNYSKDDRREQSEDEACNILYDIDAAFNVEEKLGEYISPQLAGMISKIWRDKMPLDKLKQPISKYDKPQNCEKLVAPKVNQQIWVKLQKRQKLTDLRFWYMKESVVKATVTVTKCIDQLLKANDRSGLDLRQAKGH